MSTRDFWPDEISHRGNALIQIPDCPTLLNLSQLFGSSFANGVFFLWDASRAKSGTVRLVEEKVVLVWWVREPAEGAPGQFMGLARTCAR